MISTVASRETPDGYVLSSLLILSGLSGEEGTVYNPSVRCTFSEVKRVTTPNPEDPEGPRVPAVNGLGLPAYRTLPQGRNWSWTLEGIALRDALIRAAMHAKQAVASGASLNVLLSQGFPESSLRTVAEQLEANRQAGQKTGVSDLSSDAPTPQVIDP